MNVQEYSYNSKNNDLIVNLLALRDMDPKLAEDLPNNGVLVFQDNVLVAAGFIRLIEGSSAMLDSYITNPEVAPELRNEALDKVTESLINQSKDLGISKLLSFTVEQTIIDRAIRHGFIKNSNNFQVLYHNLD